MTLRVRRLLAHVAVLAGAAIALAACGGSGPAARGGAAAAAAPSSASARDPLVGLPPVPASALDIRAPEPLADEHVTTWAPVLRRVVARSRPATDARSVVTVAARTPEETGNIVAVLGRRTVGASLWVKVRTASLPNGLVGWVPRQALGGYQTVDTHLVVDRAARSVTLLRAGRPVFTAPVGVGRDATPTPAGEFYVRDVLHQYASPTYGPVAFGTSARAATLTDWPAGGFVGIHGTDQPDLLPGAVSHGCIRLRNADILRLERLLPVGTPITIR